MPHEWLAQLCRRYLRRFGPGFAAHTECLEFMRAVRIRRNLSPSTWNAVRNLLCEPGHCLVFVRGRLYQIDRSLSERVDKFVVSKRATQLYRHFDKDGRLLYVGISLNALSRLSQHKQAAGWFRQIARVEIEHFANLGAALHAERVAIRREKPIYNISKIAPGKDPVSVVAALCKARATHIDGQSRYVPVGR